MILKAKDCINQLGSHQPVKSSLQDVFEATKNSTSSNRLLINSNNSSNVSTKTQENQHLKNQAFIAFPSVNNEKFSMNAKTSNDLSDSTNINSGGNSYCPMLFISKSNFPVISFQSDTPHIRHNSSSTKDSSEEEVTPESDF